MPSVTNRSNRKKITALRSNLLHMLALCRAGTTPQIARALGLGRRNTLFHLQALQKAELVQSVARVRLTRLGRPQGAWALSHQGARTAGGFFAREQSSDSILKGVLRAEYFSRHPDGHYPLFFEDQVALFEAHGNPWPWQTRLSPSQRDRLEKKDHRSDAPFHGPTRVGALVRERPSGIVDVVLPLLSREDGVRLLNARTLGRAGNERYHLTLVCPEQASVVLRALAEERPDLSDPFLKTKRSAWEWKTMLRTLRPKDAPYRTLIEKALARRKADDGEAFDIMPRVLPQKRCEVELLGVETIRIAAA